MKEVRAICKGVRMSPYKVRRVLNQIRGKSYEESLLILKFLPYKACDPIFKLIYSAASNAKHNEGWGKSNLKINTAYANQGPILKRFRPRAQGRGYPIRKPTCTITIGLTLN